MAGRVRDSDANGSGWGGRPLEPGPNAAMAEPVLAARDHPRAERAHHAATKRPACRSAEATHGAWSLLDGAGDGVPGEAGGRYDGQADGGDGANRCPQSRGDDGPNGDERSSERERGEPGPSPPGISDECRATGGGRGRPLVQRRIGGGLLDDVRTAMATVARVRRAGRAAGGTRNPGRVGRGSGGVSGRRVDGGNGRDLRQRPGRRCAPSPDRCCHSLLRRCGARRPDPDTRFIRARDIGRPISGQRLTTFRGQG